MKNPINTLSADGYPHVGTCVGAVIEMHLDIRSRIDVGGGSAKEQLLKAFRHAPLSSENRLVERGEFWLKDSWERSGNGRQPAGGASASGDGSDEDGKDGWADYRARKSLPESEPTSPEAQPIFGGSGTGTRKARNARWDQLEPKAATLHVGGTT